MAAIKDLQRASDRNNNIFMGVLCGLILFTLLISYLLTPKNDIDIVGKPEKYTYEDKSGNKQISTYQAAWLFKNLKIGIQICKLKQTPIFYDVKRDVYYDAAPQEAELFPASQYTLLNNYALLLVLAIAICLFSIFYKWINPILDRNLVDLAIRIGTLEAYNLINSDSTIPLKEKDRCKMSIGSHFKQDIEAARTYVAQQNFREGVKEYLNSLLQSVQPPYYNTKVKFVVNFDKEESYQDIANYFQITSIVNNRISSILKNQLNPAFGQELFYYEGVDTFSKGKIKAIEEMEEKLCSIFVILKVIPNPDYTELKSLGGKTIYKNLLLYVTIKFKNTFIKKEYFQIYYNCGVSYDYLYSEDDFSWEKLAEEMLNGTLSKIENYSKEHSALY